MYKEIYYFETRSIRWKNIKLTINNKMLQKNITDTRITITKL